MREVSLTNSNKVVLVDDEDYTKLINYKWNLGSAGRHPQAWFGDKTIEMHTLLLPVKLGFFIDHKDRNGLNNQKENLRYDTKSEQQCNVGTYSSNTSGYKGVCYHNRIAKWQVAIQVNKKRIHIGYYKDKKLAALAYNAAAIKYHGEFAVLNEIVS